MEIGVSIIHKNQKLKKNIMPQVVYQLHAFATSKNKIEVIVNYIKLSQKYIYLKGKSIKIMQVQDILKPSKRKLFSF